MATLRNGFENVNCKLLTPFTMFESFAKNVWDFGKHGEFYTGRDKEYDEHDKEICSFIDDIIRGRTFGKFCFEGIKLSFKVNNISRICLAQLTREKGFFCSESGDVKPLTQELIIPKAIYKNKDWIERYCDILNDLEKLYVDICEAGISYMDSRYIMPHCQTISLSYCSNFIDWCRSCNSRTENNFADEINLIFRQMLNEVRKACSQVKDKNSKKLIEWMLLFCDKKGPYTRDETYNNDFKRFPDKVDYVFPTSAHNDWRKSSWKIELENIYRTQQELLLPGEKEMIESWLKLEAEGKELPTTYVEGAWWNLAERIKDMPYYTGARSENVKFTTNGNIIKEMNDD